MNQLRRTFRRLVSHFRYDTSERDLSREIRAHLQLLEDEFVAKGMSPREARYAAKRSFGGVEQAKEEQRDARSYRWLAGWPMDLKLGLRMLAKSPGLTIVGVIALAVAIGAGAAFLEFTNDLLNPKLDVSGAERIVGIRAWNVERRRDDTNRLKDFDTWRVKARMLEDLGAARFLERDLTTPDGLTEPVRAVEISASAFRLVPAAPLMGRALADGDEQPYAPPVAVIGHGIWSTRFNSDPQVLGRLARLGPTDYTIVGVMPERFGFPVRENLWVPLKDTVQVHQVFARLREGATEAAAQAELDTLTDASAPGGTPGLNSRPVVRQYLDSMLSEDLGWFETIALRSLNLVFIMLLVLCGANVATLVFARTAMREGELSVRTALGASRGRICAQLFAEALVLSLLAATAGLVAARTVGKWATAMFAQGIGPMPFWWDESLSYPTLLYAYALAVFAAAIVGLVPALKATGAALQGRLREGASGTSTVKFGGIWTAVIVAQAAVTVMFLAAVVSLGWSTFTKNSDGDVIYSRDQLLTARVLLAGDGAGVDAARRQIADRLGNEPGVAGVSYSTAVPGTIWEQFEFELQSPQLQAEAEARKITDTLWSAGASVGDNFFGTLGIPLISGRDFSSAEIRQGAAVAIVDATFVRTVLGGRSPIGVTVRQRPQKSADAAQSNQPGPWLEIVGVVKDATLRKRTGPHDATVYRPALPGRPMWLLVRTQGSASPMTQRVYAAALEAHPGIRLVDLKSMAQVAEDDALPERILLRAFIVSGAIALLLATAGIYALISFTLAQRTREIGIRVALGAAPRGIIGGVFSRPFRQIGLGVIAGAVPGFVILDSISGEVGSMRLAAGLGAIAGVCAFVVAVALVSCLVPLRRALRIQPTDALRAQ